MLDPEIRKPITELGMVESVEVDPSGAVTVGVLLTTTACPLKDKLTADVTAAVTAVDGRQFGSRSTRRHDRRAAGRAAGETARRCAR